MITAVAAALLVGVTAYAIFGGADFGAGFWDLTAGGTRRGARPREIIDQSIGPVWEADHVWLIFCFVVLWTAFPEAYASIWLTLFVPLTIAAFGIVLRGSSFAFRKAVFRDRERRTFGAAFAISSVIVPYCLGTVAGGIASGRVPAGGEAGDPVHSWINPTSILGGVLAVVAVAFLASVYLVREAAHIGDDEMVKYFRLRSLGSGVAAGTVAVVGIFVLRSDSPYLYDGLTSRGLVFVLLSGVCGLAVIALMLRQQRRGTRALAVVAVASIIVAWGAAQWDYILPTTLTFDQAAAPSGTLATVLVVTVLAVLIIVPAFALLFVLDERGLLPEEGAGDDEGQAAGSRAPAR